MADPERPRAPSREWLLQAGREIQRYWNNQGPILPQPGQDFRRFWKREHRLLESPFTIVPDLDLAETLDRHAESARRWHRRHGKGDPPTFWTAPAGIGFGFALGGGAAIALVAVLGIFLLLRD